MNVALLAGISLFAIGLILAVLGITGVGFNTPAELIVTENNTSEGVSNSISTIALPVGAGLALAVGGLLIGVSLGNWKNPRTHLEPGDEVVDPEGYHTMKHV